MEEAIETEDNCVYCSKYLFGLNDFNKKMHYNTCKVRKLIESNFCQRLSSLSPLETTSPASSQSSQQNQNQTQTSNSNADLDEFLILGENCSFCFKSFKDFKSDFNKRIHVKCCKIKKETFEHRNNLSKLQQANNLSMDDQTSTGESCIFCTKPLGNLNEFNKKMHLENCKIRKSIEGNFSSPKSAKKDENMIKLSLELGAQCIYCSKSFSNLSDFNKKLHFEHCKSKKKKLNALNTSSPNINNNNISANSSFNSPNSSLILVTNSCPNTPLVNTSGSLSMMESGAISLDLGDNCLFCSRSLMNLSNFNKKVHIETCKIKQIKKATASQLRQANKPIRKRTPKKEKTNEFCSSQIMSSMDIGNNDNNMALTSAQNESNNDNMSSNSQGNQLSQFDASNATILSLNGLDGATLHQINLAANNQSNGIQNNLLNNSTHTLQITLDPNTNRIYI